MSAPLHAGAGLSVQVETDVGGLARHRAAWEALAATAPYGEWFASPAWLLPWLAVYGDERPLRFCFAYQGDHLAGVCPLMCLPATGRRCAPSAGQPVNPQVRRIGAVSRVPLAELLTAVLRALDGDAALRCLTFQQVPAGSAFALGLEDAVSRVGLHRFAWAEPPSAVVQLSDGWDAYLRALDSKLLRNLRSRRRRLERDGNWQFRLVQGAEALREAWPAVLEIEQASWKHPAGSSLVREASAGAFYRGVAEAMAATGRLRLHLLEHDGTPVAHALGVTDRQRYYLLKNSYREAYRSWSPGQSLVWHAMAEAAAAGCNTLDFLGDESDWKRDFATDLPAYDTHLLYPPGSLHCRGCRVIEETLKPLGRRLGMPTLLRRIRGHG